MDTRDRTSPPLAPVGTRRDEIMAAAVAVLAEKGPRGLTHRAVDAAAGLGSGAVNYHAPSRAKLLSLALDEVLRRDVDTLARHLDVAEWTPGLATEAITGFVIEMSSEPHRARVIARHHLRAESMTDPDLKATLDAQHASFVQIVVDAFAAAGRLISTAEAELIRMSVDGILYRQVLVDPPLTDDQIREIAALIVDR